MLLHPLEGLTRSGPGTSRQRSCSRLPADRKSALYGADQALHVPASSERHFQGSAGSKSAVVDVDSVSSRPSDAQNVRVSYVYASRSAVDLVKQPYQLGKLGMLRD